MYYLRCKQCLEPMRMSERCPGARCVCGGDLEYLGVVTGNRWRRAEELTPCDGRCTNAQGPNCDCRCRGENHGSGRTVTVLRDAGRIVLQPASAAECARRAEEYRAAVQSVHNALQARYGDDYEAYQRGTWIPSAQLRRYVWRLRGAASKKVHSLRLKELTKLAAEINAGR